MTWRRYFSETSPSNQIRRKHSYETDSHNTNPKSEVQPAHLRSLLLPFCFLLFLCHASAATRYVWQGSPGPAPPYTSWASAAHVIQEAVDAAQTGDTVLVAGGVYATGGRAVGTNLLVNRVAIDRAITVQSLMGPEVTSILGNGPTGSNAVRCVYLTNGAVLAGFTLTNGATQTSGDTYTSESGGGAWCESLSAVVSNCVLTGNLAYDYGGGAYNGTLNDCTLTGNLAYSGGGAAEGSDRRAAGSSSSAARSTP
jgi:hypothetical protein